jgi:predicted PP-loop superfamily ATPase
MSGIMEKDVKKDITKPMNEWGFIGEESLVAIRKSATKCRFKMCGLCQWRS